MSVVLVILIEVVVILIVLPDVGHRRLHPRATVLRPVGAGGQCPLCSVAQVAVGTGPAGQSVPRGQATQCEGRPIPPRKDGALIKAMETDSFKDQACRAHPVLKTPCTLLSDCHASMGPHSMCGTDSKSPSCMPLGPWLAREKGRVWL